MSDCPRCSRPTGPDAFVCRECVKTARTDLRTIAEFASWADDKRARIGSMWSVGGGSRASETPIPYDPRVTRVLMPIHNDLTTWARIVWDETPSGPDEEQPSTTTTGIACWLVAYCAWLATTEHAELAFGTWERARGNLERLFDRPPERVYLGRCNCETEFGPCVESLYVEVGEMPAQITCRRCSGTVVVDERREELAAGVENYLGTTRELSRLLSLVLGESASPRTLWAYAKHGLIQPHGTRIEHDKLGRPRPVPTYRVGEVREAARVMASDEMQRRAIRRVMRGDIAV